MEEQWLENFVRSQKLKSFGHLKWSEGIGKIILVLRKDEWEMAKRKRHMGHFQQAHNRSWKINAR